MPHVGEAKKAYDRAYHYRHKAEIATRKREWYLANKDRQYALQKERRKVRPAGLQRYHLSVERLARLRALQSDQCAGCGKPQPNHIDHDHATGRVRGLLCAPCNQALGFLRDNPTTLSNLIAYLAAPPFDGTD